MLNIVELNKLREKHIKDFTTFLREEGIKLSDLEYYRYQSWYTGNFWIELEASKKEVA